MSGFEWFLLIVVVIVVPLVVAVVVTLWTLEQARQRSRRNREESTPSTATEPVKRRATRDATADTSTPYVASGGIGDEQRRHSSGDDGFSVPDATPEVVSHVDSSGDSSSGDSGGGDSGGGSES